MEDSSAPFSGEPPPPETPASPEAPVTTPPPGEGTAGDGPATEPAAPAAETPEGAPAAGAPTDPLLAIAAEAALRRLPAGEEERATRLLKDALLDGREGITRAIAALPKLPWLIGVNAVSTAWPEMKPTFKTRLLAGLARVETEAARRVRLSLARGIFKQDVPAALKIAVSVAKDLREKESGYVSNKDCQLFANVFIGRARPWVVQLPLAELKPAEQEVVTHVALLAAFSLPHPPVTQLGILKWCAEAGRLQKLHGTVVEAIKKGLGRWSGKWRQAMYLEVKDLPEELAALVAPPVRPAPGAAPGAGEGEETPAPEAAAEEDEGPTEPTADDGAEAAEAEAGEETEETLSADDEPTGEEEAPVRERKVRPVYESKTIPGPGQQQASQPPREGREPRPEREPREGREGRENRDRRGGGGGGGGAHFNLQETLRAIDQHVHGLRQELQTAQNKLRQREDDRRRPQPGRPVPIPGELSAEELLRVNTQLEVRNAELQARLDELKEDSEARAASQAAAEADAAAPLRALLQLKLQEDYEDFMALELELPDAVVQQHYRALLRHVFEVLRAEQVPFAEPPPQPQ